MPTNRVIGYSGNKLNETDLRTVCCLCKQKTFLTRPNYDMKEACGSEVVCFNCYKSREVSQELALK